MVGCFGLLDDHHHLRFPLERLVEHNQRLDVNALAKEGGLLEGTCTSFQIGPGGGLRLVREGPIVRVEGSRILLAVEWNECRPGRVRPFWLCPSCERQCQHLYVVRESIICRKCARLDYRSRHVGRTIPNFARVLWLRRRIKASLELFTPIAPRPLHHRRYWRLVKEIRQLEAALVGHLRGDVNDVLQRRCHGRS